MAIRADDSFLTDLEELYDSVVDLDIVEQMEEDEKVLDDPFKLQESGRYIDIMQKVVEEGVVPEDVDDDAEYKFIVACNALSVDIDNEIITIHSFIRDKYKLKFPDHPIDYARRVVKKFGDVKACNRVLALDSAKKRVVHFVENRMGYIAPNLSVVVGSVVAVKLIGAAGGVSSLAKMPCCDIELLGADLKNLPRFPSPDIYDVRPLGAGYINQSGMFKSTPPSFRIQTYQLLAKKSKLAAHMDSTRGDPTGQYGTSLREEIFQMIEKWQKPRPVPVPVPTESVPCKRKRGGRVPPIKKKQTFDIMKLVNNMIFGVPEKPKEGYGMLGQAGSSGADTMSSLAFTSELSNSAKQLAGSGIQST